MKYFRLKDSLETSDRNFTKLSQIIKKLDAHQATMRVVQFLLPKEEGRHCTGARVQGATVFLTFDSNAWATRARFCTPSLMEQMKELAQFAHVEKIVVSTSRGATQFDSV